MTEKKQRFNNIYYDDFCRVIANKLDSLHEQNSQLARVNREGVKKVQKLAKENKKLKKENKKLSEKNNSLKIKNMRLKKQNKYKQPSCKNCTYFSTDGIGNYCMNEKGLLGEKGEMFPFTWNYKKGAKECKQYNDEKKLLNELINLIKNIIFEAKYEQSYSSPICQVSFFVTPEMYKILSEKLREINNDI